MLYTEILDTDNEKLVVNGDLTMWSLLEVQNIRSLSIQIRQLCLYYFNAWTLQLSY